jgi:4-hydroxybenzoate polyprenyltransferase
MFKAILKTMRPRQWPKNAFIFAALVFDRQLTHYNSLAKCIAGFAIFCLVASAVYFINDVMDVEADRQHPRKKFRPIASGKLSIPAAIATAVIILLIAIPVSFFLSPVFAAIVASYFLLNLAYSKWLKHIPLLDVLVIASDFVLRVAAGVALIQVERFSPWLYVCTTLLALYIGFGKRRAELNLLAGNAQNHRKVLEGYSIPFLDQLITIVSSCTIIAYGFYSFSAPNLPDNHTMMLTIPFVLYGVFRYLYLIQIKLEGGAPEELVFTDRPLQITIGFWGLAVIAIFYFNL